MSSSLPDLSPLAPLPDLPNFARVLRQARETQGLDVSEAAARLRLKVRLIEAIEQGDVASLGAPVFARGYISSYAQLLGLAPDLADEAMPRESAQVAAPPLRSSQRVSHGRHLLDRYARRFVYVALTASIVVPVVLVAVRDDLPAPAALLQPLPSSQETSFAVAGGGLAAQEDVGPPAPETFEQPVMASLTPFYARSTAPSRPSPEVPPAQQDAGLSIDVSGDSWVEVMDADGNRLVHELLRQGSSRQFAPGQVARVLLGNAGAVKVRMNGGEIDLTPYRRANVARFTVSSDGSLLPSGG